MSDLLTISGPKGSRVLLATYSVDPKRCVQKSDILHKGTVEDFPIILSLAKYPKIFVRLRDGEGLLLDYIYERPTYG